MGLLNLANKVVDLSGTRGLATGLQNTYFNNFTEEGKKLKEMKEKGQISADRYKEISTQGNTWKDVALGAGNLALTVGAGPAGKLVGHGVRGIGAGGRVLLNYGDDAGRAIGAIGRGTGSGQYLDDIGRGAGNFFKNTFGPKSAQAAPAVQQRANQTFNSLKNFATGGTNKGFLTKLVGGTGFAGAGVVGVNHLVNRGGNNSQPGQSEQEITVEDIVKYDEENGTLRVGNRSYSQSDFANMSDQELTALEQEMQQKRRQLEEKTRGIIRNDWGNIKSGLNQLSGNVNTKLGEYRQGLSSMINEMKNSLRERKDSQVAQIDTYRDQVRDKQRTGLRAVAEDIVNQQRSANNVLGAWGSMNSSAADAWSRIISKSADKQTKSVRTQAANMYLDLENQENKVTSTYQTELGKAQGWYNQQKNRLDRSFADLGEDVRESLSNATSLEELDVETLSNERAKEYLQRVQQLNGQLDEWSGAMEEWRLDTDSQIREMKDRIVQEFVPREITVEELDGSIDTMGNGEDSTFRNPLAFRKDREEEDPNLNNPRGLMGAVRRLREEQLPTPPVA